jgi:hypothetical protein
MNRWGVFVDEDCDDKHVLPVDADDVAVAHYPALWCWCRPYRDPVDARIIVHEDDENLGACDAHAVTRALPVFLH